MRGFTKVSTLGAMLFLFSCTPPEEQVLNTFFTALQNGDADALARVSLAPFEGDVESWEIVAVGPEARKPFALPELLESLKKTPPSPETTKSSMRSTRS